MDFRHVYVSWKGSNTVLEEVKQYMWFWSGLDKDLPVWKSSNKALPVWKSSDKDLPVRKSSDKDLLVQISSEKFG